MAPALNERVFPAPAKLNLFLHVTGRRPDGYHLLQTVFRFIDFGDTVGISLRSDGRIQRSNPLPGVSEEADLTVRAARLLQQSCGARLGADIRLEKRLPLGGGLGGGSSDAATTLLALNEMWECGLDRAGLMELGLKLGADVPAFIFGENAWAEGVGEKLQAIALPDAWYAVLTPPIQVATAEIFQAPDLTRNTQPITIAAFLHGQSRNDLEPVAIRRYPIIAEYLQWLRQFGEARMTGSGGCVFAGFASEAAARGAWANKPAGMPGFLARGLDRHPLREAV